MIYLHVDEAYAFDYLSILEVKNKQYPTPEREKAFKDCYANLMSQVGMEGLLVAYNSPEYKKLYEANELVFQLIDRIRLGDDIPSKTIDNANLERFKAKLALQKTFFEKSLIEDKITH